jgi:glycosyltransferase involved in cell wall biosynthesis
MKVLMFGWEFPPHISGGLGTASYGLTKGLTHFKDLEIIFVVPKLFGDEDHGVAKLVGASDISVQLHKSRVEEEWGENTLAQISQKVVNQESVEFQEVSEFSENITTVQINSILTPYLEPENFEAYLKNIGVKKSDLKISKDGKIYYYENGILKELVLSQSQTIEFDEEGKYQFTGSYGANLIDEVKKYARVAAQIAQLYDFDIIHAHDWLTYLAGVEAKKVSGKPLVIHVHATEFDRSGENVNQFVYDIEHYGMEHADSIITVSNLTRNIVVSRYGANPEKVHTVYNAVEPIEKRKHYYVKTVNEKVITFLGRITFQKGPEYFIEAAKLVLERTDDVRFVMAGSGDMFRRMVTHVAGLRMSHKFHFTNFLKGDEVTRMFDISDVYVMPSVSEPFGISPLEAMRSNVPVIISKQSGVAEILHHAIKVDFWDIHAIADAIYGLCKYDGLSTMFQKFGKTEVDHLKWENAAKQVRDVYLLTYYQYVN